MFSPLIVLFLILGALAVGALVVVAGIVFFLAKVKSKRGGGAPGGHVAQVQPPAIFISRQFFSRAEAPFFRLLGNTLKDRYVIMAKVRLSDVIDVRATGATWAKARNKIQSKHVDFVLLDPADLTLRLIIELDDRSHEREDRQKRDAFVDQALAQAGIPILHVAAAYTYDPQELLRQINAACGGTRIGCRR